MIICSSRDVLEMSLARAAGGVGEDQPVSQSPWALERYAMLCQDSRTREARVKEWAPEGGWGDGVELNRLAPRERL